MKRWNRWYGLLKATSARQKVAAAICVSVMAAASPTTVATVDAGTESVASGLDALLSDVGPVGAMGCYQCSICGWRNRKHKLHGNPPPSGGHLAAHKESCNDDGECSDHGTCLGEHMAAAMLELARSFQVATSRELALALNRHPKRIRINHERRTLQVLGCGGAIVANYPATNIPALYALLQ